MLSYEKIMNNKEHFLNMLIDLIGEKDITEEIKNNVLHFIQPNPEKYLDASRITKAIGQIGAIKKHNISGWGKYQYRDESATVELYINQKLIESKLADEPRKHIEVLPNFKHGQYGFSFRLLKDELKDGDIVAVKLKDDVMFLKGSHAIFTEEKQSNTK